jgi:hypothetical protein
MSLILDGTNGLSDVDGSAATPAIRGSDANTGIFFPAADTIAFAEGGVESMRINSSGSLLVGKTSASGDEKLRVAGTIAVSGAGAGAGGLEYRRGDTDALVYQIAANSGDFYIADADFSNFAQLVGQAFTGWTFGSDRRIKKNIVDLTYGLNAVLALQPRAFEYINNDQHDIGFIAQELKEVIPEAVSGEEVPYADEDTPQERAKKTMGITKDALIPVLVKAIQEQQAIITALTARVEALEGAQA